jgi:hypothetical protein
MVMKRILPWLVVFALITVVFGTIYGAVQQAQRNDANWPQIQMSEDIATKLDDKAEATVLTPDQVDITKSLKPFTIIYDKKGKPISGSGFINSKLPNADMGVLDNSKGKDYNAVTWTPTDDTRIAAVVVEAKDYYVLSGRSLEESEKNENTTLFITFVGWLISVLLLAGLFVASTRTTEA